MIIFDYIAQIVTLVACIVIFWRAEAVLNCCHFERTALLINVAFYMLTIGAMVLGWSVLTGYVPSWPTALITAGVAMLLFCERRVRVLFRYSGHKRQGVA